MVFMPQVEVVMDMGCAAMTVAMLMDQVIF
jgi:hypothetical protein